MTSGNGFGFLVYSPAERAITKFYPHPSRFLTQDRRDPHADGPETPNLIERLAWKSPGAPQPEYLDQSSVISLRQPGLQQSFFSPFGLRRNALVAVAAPSDDKPAPALELRWARRVQSTRDATVDGTKVQVLNLQGFSGAVVVVPLNASPPSTAHGVAIVTVDRPDEVNAAVKDVLAWQHGANPQTLAEREAKELNAWRAAPPPGLSPDELALWRQSEALLRMAQIREPSTATRHGEGLVLASLPDGEWYIPWVRDMSYATVALTRMGHPDEARAALSALLNADPHIPKDVARYIHGADAVVSVDRYKNDGQWDTDRSEQPRPNIELDSWGLALWAMGEYVGTNDAKPWLESKTRLGKTVYETMRDNVVAPLLANLDRYQGDPDALLVAKDSSSWEQNDEPYRHYAWSTLQAINGLRSFEGIARRMGDEGTLAKVNDAMAKLQRGFERAFVREGRLHGVALTELAANKKRNDTDAAELEAINFGVITDPAVVDRTLADITAKLSEPSGGIRRTTGTTSYESHEFLWSDFALARAYLKTGRTADADRVVSRIVQRSRADSDLIPEMYVSRENDEDFPGKIGDPTGATPMVGYGAGAYLLYLLERARRGS